MRRGDQIGLVAQVVIHNFHSEYHSSSQGSTTLLVFAQAQREGPDCPLLAPPRPRPQPRLGSRLPLPSLPVIRKGHASGVRAPARAPPPSAHALPGAYRVPCRWQLLRPPPSPSARRQAVHAASRTASQATRRREHTTTCLEKPMRGRGAWPEIHCAS